MEGDENLFQMVINSADGKKKTFLLNSECFDDLRVHLQKVVGQKLVLK